MRRWSDVHPLSPRRRLRAARYAPAPRPRRQRRAAASAAPPAPEPAVGASELGAALGVAGVDAGALASPVVGPAWPLAPAVASVVGVAPALEAAACSAAGAVVAPRRGRRCCCAGFAGAGARAVPRRAQRARPRARCRRADRRSGSAARRSGTSVHAQARGLRLDAVAGRQFGVFDAERRVLALQQRRALERAADARVQLEQPSCSVTIPISANAIRRDPRPPADQAVEQRGGARRPRALQQAERKAALGAERARLDAGAARGGAGPETRRGPRGAARGRRGARALRARWIAGAAAAAGGVTTRLPLVGQLAGRAQARRGGARVARDLLGARARSSGA